MKKIKILASCITFLLLSSYTSAFGGNGSCNAPSFLQTGKTYSMQIRSSYATAQVIEIDRNSCWIQVKTGAGEILWVNLNSVATIKE